MALPGDSSGNSDDLFRDEREAEGLDLQTAINELRTEVDRWRQIPNPNDWKVTPETQRLLLHWRNPEFEGLRPFFCQVEAAEVAIYLSEVAPKTAKSKRFLQRLRDESETANPDLFRIALKLATGAGKTTVMAMLIAWQAINAARRPNSKNYSKGFLLVAPGITIRDRLRVLMPNDPENYYRHRGLVPTDMLPDLGQAKVVITNYHSFKLREKIELSKGGRSALTGHGEELKTLETEGQMVQRVLGDLMALKNIVVINDEAHHCYRVRPDAEDEDLDKDEKKEAKENAENAKLWISGLEAVNRILGVRTVYDLSATPFFLHGSGYPAGSLFPWVVSDFSLVDAIECGIVKLPRVPVSDNLPTGEAPLYRNLWPAIRKGMPTGTRTTNRLDPQSLPIEVKTALDALYGHYERTFELWEQNQMGVPPVFIVVCANTVASELVAEYISGYERTDENEQTDYFAGKFELLRNFSQHGDRLNKPRTLLIDSRQVDSGEAISKDFLAAAGPELEIFKREVAARQGAEAARVLSEGDVLREVMNTVGQKGRLGEQIRCVVSVGMLTEGWDANNVTHVLGLRAFGSRLLCEQVMGRALRRMSYALNDDGLFEVEYADIMGIDGLNLAPQDAVDTKPRKPRKTTRIEAVSPDRDHLEIIFPRVEGYRIELPPTKIRADWSKLEPYVLTQEITGACEVEMRGIVGAPEVLNLEYLRGVRKNEIILKLSSHMIMHKLRDEDGEPKIHLITQVKPIVRKFLDEYLVCKGGTVPAQLMHLQLAEEVSELLLGVINLAHAEEQPIRALLSPYQPVGSTMDVGMNSVSENLHESKEDRSHINYVVWDSPWEHDFAKLLDVHPNVVSYVKNHGLGLNVPYTMNGQTKEYRPDFIITCDDGKGDTFNLIVEIKGYRGHDAMLKATTMHQQWIPGVNRLGRFGRWAFAELREIHGLKNKLDEAIADALTEFSK
nr:DEAD/DEAH box helicase family protein [Ruegeria lacuscaerulensis]